MISIVICSRFPSLSTDIKKNIERTIGCDYELKVIDNSKNEYSIFEAYNLGRKKSKGSIICFLHDDVKFHTRNWGDYLKSCFEKNPNLGLLGVAGAKIKTRTPSAWWDCPEELKVINIIQHKNGKKKLRNTGFLDESTEVEVAVIDGVFMALRKVHNLSYNEKFWGFHNYDLNISMENHIKGFETVVTRNILLEHFSSGVINKNWYLTTKEIHKLYKNNLPINKADISEKELSSFEFKNGMVFIEKLYRAGHKTEAIRNWQRLVFLKPFSIDHLRLLKLFFITE